MAKVRFKTPLCELRWVFIDEGGRDTSEAKDGSKMQKQASGYLFKGKDDQAIEQTKAELTNIWEMLKAEHGIKVVNPKSLGIKEVLDSETKEPTGDFVINFKTMAHWKDGSDVEIPIYNAKGEKTSLGEAKIGNGTIGVIHGEADIYNFKGQVGITLYLKAIQIVKLVEYNANMVEAEDLTAQYNGEVFEAGPGAVPAVETPAPEL